MSFHLRFSQDAQRQLKKMDRHQAQLLVNWLYANVDGLVDPRSKGKALSANLRGLWRYRIGNFRVICQIQDDQLLVLVLTVGHRRDIYLDRL